MSKEFCDFDDYDWSEDTLLTVIDCAQQGIPTAIAEYNKRKKELDLPPLDTLNASS